MTIDMTKLRQDLGLSGLVFKSLELPNDVSVTSGSAIKINTVADTLHLVKPNQLFELTSLKAPSGVAEQPVGRVAIDGALNRLHGALQALDNPQSAVFSIENGLFRVSDDYCEPISDASEFLLSSEGADLSSEFDPEAEYEDRAVSAIKIGDHPIVVHISPKSEAVPFPKKAVLAAHQRPNGFNKHTVGAELFAMGLVSDPQNPHLELTNGTFSRQEQMMRVMIRTLKTIGGLDERSKQKIDR
jgi:hypothetical protein